MHELTDAEWLRSLLVAERATRRPSVQAHTEVHATKRARLAVDDYSIGDALASCREGMARLRATLVPHERKNYFRRKFRNAVLRFAVVHCRHRVPLFSARVGIPSGGSRLGSPWMRTRCHTS